MDITVRNLMEAAMNTGELFWCIVFLVLWCHVAALCFLRCGVAYCVCMPVEGFAEDTGNKMLLLNIS